MATFDEILDSIEELTWLSGSGCSFYTVRKKGANANEFTQFLTKMESRKTEKLEFEEQIKILSALITRIAKKGADSKWFRHEGGGSVALPDDKNIKGLPAIRLYCMRLSNEVVILYNGDFKTKNKPEDCPNVRIHFLFAKSITPIMDKAFLPKGFVEPALQIIGKRIISNDDSILII